MPQPVVVPAWVSSWGIDASTWGTIQILTVIAFVVLLSFLCSFADTESPEARAQLAAARVRDDQSRRALAARIRALGRRTKRE